MIKTPGVVEYGYAYQECKWVKYSLLVYIFIFTTHSVWLDMRTVEGVCVSTLGKSKQSGVFS